MQNQVLKKRFVRDVGLPFVYFKYICAEREREREIAELGFRKRVYGTYLYGSLCNNIQGRSCFVEHKNS